MDERAYKRGKGPFMSSLKVHDCQCASCQQAVEHPDKTIHPLMNLFLSRLNEQQRRWYVGLESKKQGHGGDQQMSQITGMNVETIRRGRRELDAGLSGRPVEQVRLPGGGRPRVEKKNHK